LDSLPTNRQSARRALGISIGLHGALFIAMLCTALFTPPPTPHPRALLVRTVSLKAGPAVRISATPKAQAAARQAETPPGPPKPPEEIIGEKGPGEPSEEPPRPEESKGGEEASTEEPPAPVQKSTSPAKTPTKASAASKVSTAAKASAGLKKAPSKTQPSPSKTAPGKGKAVSKGSTSSQRSSASQYDQNLLSEALRRLDRSKSAAAKGEGGSGNGSGGNSGAGSGGTARVGTVGALNVDSGLVAGGSEGDEAYDGYTTASPEACYIGDLIRRLQLNVRLPEPGEVRVKLTLKRGGSISSIEVLSGNKASIKQAIEKKLRVVHFSPFGISFSGESEHTFNLRLSNDLIWCACS
jgi:outer membrane biosynthesis protein TonB